MLPNLYDDAGLTVYEHRLLAHYARVGDCYEATRTTAETCKMSTGQVSEARKTLADKGFIGLGVGEKGTIRVTVTDKWAENTAKYGGAAQALAGRSPHEQPSQDERDRSPHEQKRSPHETKEDSSKKNQEEEGKEGAERTKPPAAVEAYREIARRYPDKATWEMIAHVVGEDEADLKLWQHSIKAGIAAGWNKLNVAAMLDVFNNGGVIRRRPNEEPKGYEALRKFAQRRETRQGG
jgi:hypothetical protein